jgi:hypothetical protein
MAAWTGGRWGMAARSLEWGLWPLWGTGAHRWGQKMEGVARWSHFRPHRGSGSGVVTGDGDEAVAVAALKLQERGKRERVGAVRIGGGVSLL